MEPLSVLRADHARLRQKLLLLESALQVAPEARLVLREMCCSLLRLLQEHVHRETQALQTYDPSTRAPALAAGPLLGVVPSERSESRDDEQARSAQERLGVADHVVEQRLLRAVNELLLSGMRASVPMIILRLSQAIEQLRAQMEAQERTVFAALARLEGAGGEAPASISGAMSINEVLHHYPQTQRIFEQLRINRLQDGYDSVDEVAWRRGMDVSQMIEQLRQAVTAAHYSSSESS